MQDVPQPEGASYSVRTSVRARFKRKNGARSALMKRRNHTGRAGGAEGRTAERRGRSAFVWRWEGGVRCGCWLGEGWTGCGF